MGALDPPAAATAGPDRDPEPGHHRCWLFGKVDLPLVRDRFQGDVAAAVRATRRQARVHDAIRVHRGPPVPVTTIGSTRLAARLRRIR